MRRAMGERFLGLLRNGLARGVLCGVWVLAAATAINCRCDDMDAPDAPGAPGSPGASVIYEVPVLRVRLSAAGATEARIATTGSYWLRADGRVIAESGAAWGPVAVRRSGPVWRIGDRRVEARELELLPAGGAFVRFDGTTYRGRLRLLRDEGDSRLLVVNHVHVESYLAGVLAKELYRSWAPATYGALAVAARTFALYQRMTFGASHQYDLGDTQASQVYGGLNAETSKARQAVRETQGIVLSHGPRGRERVFLAQYSACCGGRVNGAYVIRNAHRIPPLEGGQVCTDCRQCRRYRWPNVRISKRDIHRALSRRYAAARNLAGVHKIRVHTTAPGGRAVWIDVVGNAGEKIRIRAEDLRLALIFNGSAAAKKLYSMNCRIVDRGASIEFADGRGFGHGVGLCQWGAQGKALAGWSAERILEFYYPGATLYRVY